LIGQKDPHAEVDCDKIVKGLNEIKDLSSDRNNIGTIAAIKNDILRKGNEIKVKKTENVNTSVEHLNE
jgi:hypothetical protein